MTIFIWLVIIAIFLFSISVIQQGAQNAWCIWVEDKNSFFESLESDLICTYGRPSCFCWSFNAFGYYLDVSYSPISKFALPLYINYRGVRMKTWVFAWFMLDVTKATIYES